MLYKGFDFEKKPDIKHPNNVLKIIYMGNIGSGRWQILSKVARAINELNKTFPTVCTIHILALRAEWHCVPNGIALRACHWRCVACVPDGKPCHLRMKSLSDSNNCLASSTAAMNVCTPSLLYLPVS